MSFALVCDHRDEATYPGRIQATLKTSLAMSCWTGIPQSNRAVAHGGGARDGIGDPRKLPLPGGKSDGAKNVSRFLLRLSAAFWYLAV